MSGRKYRVEFELADGSGEVVVRRSFHNTRENAEKRVTEYLAWFESDDYKQGNESARCVAHRIVEVLK
jgi:hypothetical protein